MKSAKNGAWVVAIAVAAAASVAGGCNRADAVTVSEVCAAICEQYEYCDPNGYDAGYDTLSECREICEQDLGAELDGYEPAACLDEELEWQLCRAELSCYDLGRGDYGDCDREIDALDHCFAESAGSYDNVGACQQAEAAMNGLPCMESDVDFSCDAYSDVECDYTDYFGCIAGMYSCDGGQLVFDDVAYEECVQIADETAASCDEGWGDGGGDDGDDEGDWE